MNYSKRHVEQAKDKNRKSEKIREQLLQIVLFKGNIYR